MTEDDDDVEEWTLPRINRLARDIQAAMEQRGEPVSAGRLQALVEAHIRKG